MWTLLVLQHKILNPPAKTLKFMKFYLKLSSFGSGGQIQILKPPIYGARTFTPVHQFLCGSIKNSSQEK